MIKSNKKKKISEKIGGKTKSIGKRSRKKWKEMARKSGQTNVGRSS